MSEAVNEPGGSLTRKAEDADADTVLRGGAEAPIRDESSDLLGQTIGRYRILALLGRGGMGYVYEAEDLELRRRVALKFVRAELLHRPEIRDRFLRERSVTAELEHPGIVAVYGSGISPDGEPFYVMRIARGEPLDRLLVRAGTLEARLALLPNMIAAADAVAFAHSRGIVHRDLKPANILVGSFGETLVADWGLAKRLRHDEEGAPGPAVASGPSETQDGAVMGTPEYMAPEQARGDDVDERTDVYALGAMLFHIVAGRPARGGEVLQKEAGALADVVAIVRKAMAGDPGARYRGAKELADELRRFLAGQIVDARRYTRAELVRRWARRHRLVLAVAASLGALLLAFAVASVIRIARERDAAETARRVAAERNDALVLLQARALLDRDPTATLAWLKTYPAASPGWAQASEIASDAWSRGIARHVWRGPQAFVSVAIGPDARFVAAASNEAAVRVWDAASGEERLLRSDVTIGPIAFSPDGALLAASDGRSTVRVWDLATSKRRDLPPAPSGAVRVTFSPDGRWLLAEGSLNGVFVYDLAGGPGFSIDTGAGLPIAAAFVPGGLVVVDRREVQRVNLATGERRRLGEHGVVAAAHALAASPDGRWVVVGGDDGKLAVFDQTGGSRRVLAASPATTARLVFVSNEDVVACGSLPGIFQWTLARGTARPVAGRIPCTMLAAVPDGRLLVVDESNRLTLWDTNAPTGRPLLGHQATVAAIAVSADGRWVASASADRTVRLWRLGEGDVRVFRSMMGPAMVFPDGRKLLASTMDGWAARVLDIGGQADIAVTGPRARVWLASGAVAPDGRRVAVGDADEQLLLVDVIDGSRVSLGRYGPPGALDLAEAFSPDGRFIAVATNDGAIQMVSIETASWRLLGRHASKPLAVTFSPDGRTVATAGRDKVIRLWDVATGGERVLNGHTGDVYDVSYSRDGKQLVTASADGTVRVWNPVTGANRTIGAHAGEANSAMFSPDGSRVISAGGDQTARVWDVASGEGRVVRRDTAAIWSARWAPDASFVVTHGVSNAVWVWDPQATPAFERDPSRLRGWMDRETTAEVDAEGRLATPAR